MKSPFKFLDAYGPKDKDVFFGRKEETDELYSMVFKTPLLLIYGLSGTGKTSLIRCGLASRFAGPNWYPFYIRRGDDLNASMRSALNPALPKGERIPESLRDTVTLLFNYHLRPVYLIFDQFEELFILGEREEQLAFARSIRELMDAELPCKIILVMREEFIGQLYHLEREIPTIYDFRLRVEPMGYKKVQEVIAGSFGAFHVALEAPEQNTEHIYENISAGKSGVQLPYLQVYMDMLWRERYEKTYGATPLEEGAPWPPLQISTVDIEGFGDIEDVLARFLEEREAQLQQSLETEFPGTAEHTVRKVFDVFVTERGTKKPIRFLQEGKDLLLEAPEDKPLPDLPQPVWTFVLAHLQDDRLLRERDGALELAHDSLAALIDEKRSDEEKRYNRIRQEIRVFFQAGQFLTRDYFAKNEDDFPKLGLDETLTRFVDQSREDIEEQDRLEMEKKERELRLTKEKLAAEERASRRQRIFLVLISIVALLAIGAGIYGYLQKQEADKSARRL